MVQQQLETRQCPYCLRETLEPAPEFGTKWYKCTGCGATHYFYPKHKGWRKKVKL